MRVQRLLTSASLIFLLALTLSVAAAKVAEAQTCTQLAVPDTASAAAPLVDCNAVYMMFVQPPSTISNASAITIIEYCSYALTLSAPTVKLNGLTTDFRDHYHEPDTLAFKDFCHGQGLPGSRTGQTYDTMTFRPGHNEITANICNDAECIADSVAVSFAPPWHATITPPVSPLRVFAGRLDTAQFVVARNDGDTITTNFTISAVCSGAADAGCSAPSQVTLHGGQHTTVNVTFTGGASISTGTIQLIATEQYNANVSDNATVSVISSAPACDGRVWTVGSGVCQEPARRVACYMYRDALLGLQMNSTRRVCKALTFALFIGSGCSTRSEKSASSHALADSVQKLLVDELKNDVANSDLPDSFDAHDLTFQIDHSRVVPSLSYQWAVFRSVRVTHGIATAVAGSRDGLLRVIRTSNDWAYLSSGWSAADSTQAREACLELIRVIEARWPDVRPTFYGVGFPFPSYVGADTNYIKEHLHDHETVTEIGPIWRVRGWVVQPALTVLAVRYQCTVPAAAIAGDSVSVSVTDSLVRPRGIEAEPAVAPKL